MRKYKLSSLILVTSIIFISCNSENKSSCSDSQNVNSKFDKVFEGTISDKDGVLSLEEYYNRFGINDKNQIVNYLADNGFSDDKIIHGIWLIVDHLRYMNIALLEFKSQPDSFKIEGEMLSFYKDKLGYTDNEIKVLEDYSIKIFKESDFNIDIE